MYLSNLNLRQRRIILTILKAAEPITAFDIGRELKISPRAVRYSLNKAQPLLELDNIHIKLVRGVGIELTAPNLNKKQLVKLLSNPDECKVILNSKQRERTLLLRLLTNRKPITADQLAEKMGVSRSTIFNNIKQSEDFFGEFDLLIIRRPRVGLWLEGEENSRRKALLQLLREEFSTEIHNALWSFDRIDEILFNIDTPDFVGFIKKLELSFSQQVIQRAERVMNATFTRESRILTQLYIALAIQAMKDNHHISEAPSNFKEIDYPEKKIAELISREISNAYGLVVPEGEICIICARLRSAQIVQPTTNFISQDNKIEKPESEIITIAQKIADCVSIYFHPWLQVDFQFVHGLSLHLSPIISSLRAGFGVYNPMLDLIKEAYPGIYRMVERISPSFESYFGVPIPPDELGYITMHLVAALERLKVVTQKKRRVIVACSGDISIPILLCAQLKTEFPNLEIQEVYFGIDKIDSLPSGAELIIANESIQDMTIPVIQVSSILSAKNFSDIEEWIYEQEVLERHNQKIEPEIPSVVDLIDISSIVIGAKASSWEEMVEVAAQPLVKNRKIDAGYVDAMKILISKYGPYSVLAPGVVVLHAKPSDGVNSFCLGLCTLVNGVRFGHDQYDPVDIAFVLGVAEPGSHLNALFQLAELVTNLQFRTDLRKARNSAEALRVVWRHLPQNCSP